MGGGEEAVRAEPSSLLTRKLLDAALIIMLVLSNFKYNKINFRETKH